MRTKGTIQEAALVGFLTILGAGGCDLVAGIGEYCTEGVDPGCGTGGNTGSSENGGTGGTTTSSTGGGGTGGTTTTSTGGGGSAPDCNPPATQECYDGPQGTKDVGICKAGTQACQPAGTWGQCEDQQAPMAEDCSAPADEDCNFGVGCSETAWANVFGDDSDQRVRALAYDNDGNLLAAGTFSGTLNFGGASLIGTNNDVFVVKLGADGSHLWSRHYGDAEYQGATGVAVDGEGNIVVSGYFSGEMEIGDVTLSDQGGMDAFVFKLSPDGEKIWARSFGDSGPEQAIGDLAIDKDDNILLVGDFNGELDFDGNVVTAVGGRDTFIAKLSPGGTAIWAKAFGDNLNQYGTDVAVDSVGNISITGEFSGTMNFGSGKTVTATNADTYVARFDAAGSCLWARRIDAVGNVRPGGLIADSAGDVVVAMETNSNTDAGGGTLIVSTYDVVVAKYSSGGVFQWHKSVGGTGEEYAPRLAVDTQNRLMLGFYSSSAVDIGGEQLPSGGGYDIVVSALQPSGDLLWAKRYGLIGDQTSPVLAVGPKGEIGLGCTAGGDIDFGGGVLSAKGTDVALAIIGPN